MKNGFNSFNRLIASAILLIGSCAFTHAPTAWAEVSDCQLQMEAYAKGVKIYCERTGDPNCELGVGYYVKGGTGETYFMTEIDSVLYKLGEILNNCLKRNGAFAPRNFMDMADDVEPIDCSEENAKALEAETRHCQSEEGKPDCVNGKIDLLTTYVIDGVPVRRMTANQYLDAVESLGDCEAIQNKRAMLKALYGYLAKEK